MKKLAILAYGSLIDSPGEELEKRIMKPLLPVLTPFKIEYARSSMGRGGAPTLVPVEEGRSNVNARLLVLSDATSEKEAKDMLWRRETGRAQGSYDPPPHPGPNTVLVGELRSFEGVTLVLYTRIAANIPPPLTGQKLADLAIKSAKSPNVEKGRDGISYLINAKKAGIKTPLSPDYEAAVLELTSTDSLEAALLFLGRDFP